MTFLDFFSDFENVQILLATAIIAAIVMYFFYKAVKFRCAHEQELRSKEYEYQLKKQFAQHAQDLKIHSKGELVQIPGGRQ